ncbi:retroviral-like aspartic protease family protein [Sphingobacterium siyangense]|uniref:retropepsin-like aspartic protease n=1 Tax=Sphingobacterium TaxID=28453 RepID=UPI000B48C92B|nr:MULTISPECIES: retropepsin-like aspartic protease [Sphingobacterium]UQA73179.1 retroviral-like aspartic protease family protein [Sphingobacterium siyangense]
MYKTVLTRQFYLSVIAIIILPFATLGQSLPLQLLPSGHIVVEAEIEGKKGNFIFDTGGGINLFFEDFAKDLKKNESYNFLTAFRATGEKMTIPLYRSSTIKFNGKEFNDIPFSTFDMKLAGINGLISLPMLYDTEFIIDYTKKQLIFPKAKLKSDKIIPIQLTTNADQSLDISTYIYLNDKYRINILLDSGAGDDSFWFSDRFIPILGLDPSKLEITERASEFNPEIKTKYYKGHIASISNSSVKVEHPTVSFVEGLIYEGKTSINWLGKKLGFNLKEKKIYLLD